MNVMKKLDLMIVLLIGLIAAALLTSCYPTKMRANYGKTCPTFRR
jgi:hypothetical protein